ncbi:MAG: polysaccharide biosynthesis/export family protein [Bryobacteraceae bacterium]
MVRKTLHIGFLFLLGALVIAGQTQQPAPQGQNQSTSQPPAAKPPAEPNPAVGAGVDPDTYRMGPEDVLFVRVWREPDFSLLVSVRPDGKITMPLVGDIQAGGLTPIELGKDVAKSLTKYINTPDVTIIVQQVNSKKYYITGEVQKTGAFPLVVPTTVLQALSGAGGFREFANQKKIKILRGKQRFRFNYKQVISGKHLEQNIYLQNGDYVIVPD